MPGTRELLSLIIPVYKNQENLDRLFGELEKLRQRIAIDFEVVFVVDGSPDRCFEILEQRLPRAPFRSQLILLSRNFGSFNAITAGLGVAKGQYMAAIAADLQEPPELVVQFLEVLRAGDAEVVFGSRSGRSDAFFTELSSNLFWTLYRRLVIKDMPAGGVDVFGCNRRVRDHVVAFPEANTNLIALLFWLGFKRQFITYDRLARQEGKSAWTFRKKLRYSLDSIFNFTDLPVQMLLYLGLLGMSFAAVFSVVLIVLKLWHQIPVPGYTAIVLTLVFFGGLTSLGLGILGQYLWLTLQNARRRPNFVVASQAEHGER